MAKVVAGTKQCVVSTCLGLFVQESREAQAWTGSEAIGGKS